MNDETSARELVDAHPPEFGDAASTAMYPEDTVVVYVMQAFEAERARIVEKLNRLRPLRKMWTIEEIVEALQP